MTLHEEIAGLIDYSPDTGALAWKTSNGRRIRKGDPAGTICNGYVRICINYKLYAGHRVAWLLMTGEWPDMIDHINHDKTDNRWCNLRNATALDNQRNRPIQQNNKSGLTGVCFDKRWNKWRVEISVNKSRKHLGYFEDYFDAACTRKSAENNYGFHENHGR